MQDLETTIGVWAPIYEDQATGEIRVALDVTDPAGPYEVVNQEAIPLRGTLLPTALTRDVPTSVVVIGPRLLESISLVGLPPPTWAEVGESGAEGDESLLENATGIVAGYLDQLGDLAVRKFESLLPTALRGSATSDPSVDQMRHLLYICEGNWRMEKDQRLILRASFEKLLGSTEQYERVIRVASRSSADLDLENRSNGFIVGALRRTVQAASMERVISGVTGSTQTISLANLAGAAEPVAVKREILLPIEIAQHGGKLVLNLAEDGQLSSQSRVWTERSLLLSLALLSSGVMPSVDVPEAGVQKQLDRAGLDLFLKELQTVDELDAVQQRLHLEGELAGVWRGVEPDGDPVLVGDRNRLVIANPHLLAAARLRFFRKTLISWTDTRVTALLQRETSPMLSMLLHEVAEAAAELVKNIVQHAHLDDPDEVASGRLRSFLEVFFTRGGLRRSGNRLHIVAVDAGSGIPTTARPKLGAALPGHEVIEQVLAGALKGVEPGRGYGLPEVSQLVDRYSRFVDDTPVSSRLFVASGDTEKGELSLVSRRQGISESADSIPTSLGMGTVLWVQLPLAAELGKPSRRNRRTAAAQRSLPGIASGEA